MQDAKAAKVAIVMGSDSDWPVMKACKNLLGQFGVACEVRVLSAHRTPGQVAELAAGAKGQGFQVIIAAAGMAAALPGVVAAHTTLPVIGVPIAGGTMGGMDALLSIAQMPPGVPVACVAVNGAKNAALLAVQMIAISDSDMATRLQEYKSSLAAAVVKADQSLQDQLAGQ